MSYEEFYGLKEEPFAITPDPKFFYESDQHMGALIRVQHAIDSSKGLCVVIGDMGLGKTFISRKILEKLQADEGKYEVSLLIIIHHEITAAWLIKRIALSLGIEFPAEDKSNLISQICRQLIQIDDSGKKTVLLIDEAHMLQLKEIYEELRGLLNVEARNHKLLNIILFGSLELENFLQLDPPLVSRIGLKFTLKPLDKKATTGYIAHRLKVSGASREIFTPEACEIIFAASRGVPRLINTISDNALLEGFLEKKERIGPEIIAAVADSLGIKKPEEPSSSSESESEGEKNKDEQQKKKKVGDWYYT
ncbi:MAG: AAA family ATPase [Candidatus Firestonebacteria bacterium]